jgi:translation elongation factor EF-Ts
VARTEQFQSLARDLAMQVVASRPDYVSRDEISAAVKEKERAIFREQMADSGKPAKILDQIIEGKLDKWYGEICLLEQSFIKDPELTVQDLITRSIATLGENIRVRLVLLDKGVMRGHHKVRCAGGGGELTSGGFSPTLNRSIGLARVPPKVAAGDTIEVEVRAKWLQARAVKPPFVRHGKQLVIV